MPIVLQHTPARLIGDLAVNAGTYATGVQNSELALRAAAQAQSMAQAQARMQEQQRSGEENRQYRQQQLDQQRQLKEEGYAQQTAMEHQKAADRLEQIATQMERQGANAEAVQQLRGQAAAERQTAALANRSDIAGQRYQTANRGLDVREQYNQGRLDQGQARLDLGQDRMSAIKDHWAQADATNAAEAARRREALDARLSGDPSLRRQDDYFRMADRDLQAQIRAVSAQLRRLDPMDPRSGDLAGTLKALQGQAQDNATEYWNFLHQSTGAAAAGGGGGGAELNQLGGAYGTQVGLNVAQFEQERFRPSGGPPAAAGGGVGAVPVDDGTSGEDEQGAVPIEDEMASHVAVLKARGAPHEVILRHLVDTFGDTLGIDQQGSGGAADPTSDDTAEA